MNTGFIGLGNIGKPIAIQILKLGSRLTVYDVNPDATYDMVQRGAYLAKTAAEVARNSEIVGICVRDDADVNALLYGEEGLLTNGAAGMIIAIHSTVTQAAILRWAAEGATRGIYLIDAPITGGASGAEVGTLTYMVGGPEELVERCRPVFQASGQKIIHAGPLGSGIALKLCNNMMTYAAFAAIHEAAALAKASNLDPQMLIEVGRSNGVVTPQMEAFLGNRQKLAAGGEEMLRKAFAPFSALAKKDLAAALQSAEALSLSLPMTRQVAASMDETFMARIETVRN